MRKNAIILFFAILAGMAYSADMASDSVFAMPEKMRKHQQLQAQFIYAARTGKTAQMEELARMGCALLPKDPTWRYNLACALAYNADKNASIAALDQAIELGFTDRRQMERDSDLKQLAGDPRFTMLLRKADAWKTKPRPHQPRTEWVYEGAPVEVHSTNTIWNFQASTFQALFQMKRPYGATPASVAEDYRGPAQKEMTQWLKGGTAASNFGDLYVNRDRGHSALVVSNFPGLTPVRFSAEAKRFYVDQGLPNMLFPAPVLGNCSMAYTDPRFWRSMPRMSQSDPARAMLCSSLFLNSQMWFFPAHKDFSSAGDLFLANHPVFLVTEGSSFTDLPFVEAFAGALAALHPEVKRALLRRRLLSSTMQALFRASRKGMGIKEYFTGKAHPVVFERSSLDAEEMIRRAHALTEEDIPPAAFLRVMEETELKPGVDFFDGTSERLFTTAFGVARLFRGVQRERKMKVSVTPFGAHPGQRVRFQWRVLQGDPAKVKIRTLNETESVVEMTVSYPGFFMQDGRKTGRIDIGCFAVREGKMPSMPSILSFSSIAPETRVYREDGKILSMDYTTPALTYYDSLVTMPKGWKDFYQYDDQGRCTGWVRKHPTGVEQYTWAGHRVVQRDAKGRPLTARGVKYLPRRDGGENALPSLTTVLEEKVYTYSYVNEKDQVGKYR